jgi:hypothetical protein
VQAGEHAGAGARLARLGRRFRFHLVRRRLLRGPLHGLGRRRLGWIGSGRNGLGWNGLGWNGLGWKRGLLRSWENLIGRFVSGFVHRRLAGFVRGLVNGRLTGLFIDRGLTGVLGERWKGKRGEREPE